jgi:hypothetical protein
LVIYQNRVAHNSNRATTHSCSLLDTAQQPKEKLLATQGWLKQKQGNNSYELDTTSGAATSGNMRLETIAVEATTSKGWTQEQQLLRAGHIIRRSSNFWQHEAGDDGSRSNNF